MASPLASCPLREHAIQADETCLAKWLELLRRALHLSMPFCPFVVPYKHSRITAIASTFNNSTPELIDAHTLERQTRAALGKLSKPRFFSCLNKVHLLLATIPQGFLEVVTGNGHGFGGYGTEVGRGGEIDPLAKGSSFCGSAATLPPHTAMWGGFVSWR
eukprot:4792818-Amphidinium_carterae.1